LKPPKLQLLEIFQSEAAEIVVARTKAKLLHHTRNIRAGGDEVEQTVREVLGRRLPRRYYVGHGHIVDSKLSVSPQLDIVISDGLMAPNLFTSAAGSEYFPYESVYAIGEIKSGYYPNKEPIQNFIATITLIKERLKKKPTPRNYMGLGHARLSELEAYVDYLYPTYENHLFAFMLFVHADHLDVGKVLALLTDAPQNNVPDILCFLNKGVFFKDYVVLKPDGSTRVATAEDYNGNPYIATAQMKEVWSYSRFEDAVNNLGIGLCFLYYLLLEHLDACEITPPVMSHYLSFLLKEPQTLQTMPQTTDEDEG